MTDSLVAQATTTPPPNAVIDAPCGAGPLGPHTRTNAEVQQAYDAQHGLLYETWIGCGGIGFSRSLDGGLSFQPAYAVPGSFKPVLACSSLQGPASYSSWDPAIALAPNGTIYVSFMVHTCGSSLSNDAPVLAWSNNEGVSFQGYSFVRPPQVNVFGDRDFVTVAPNGTIDLTWDLGPNGSLIHIACAPHGSCYYTAGDLNVVLSSSTDGGRTWSIPVPISPGYPLGGAVAAPVLVEPNGTLDVLYEDYSITNNSTHSLGPGNDFFTRSTDGGRSWSPPVRVSSGPIAPDIYWIDAALSRDSGGTLYAGLDAQLPSGYDEPLLAYSTNDGASWTDEQVAPPVAAPGVDIMVTPAGGAPGSAYVAWMTNNTTNGTWSTYAQVFRTANQTFTSPRLLSDAQGDPDNWTGDTIGVSSLGGGSAAVSWSYGACPSYPCSMTTASEVYGARYGQFYPVTFSEIGLPTSASSDWWVNLTGIWSLRGAGPTLNAALPNGTYAYTASAGGAAYAGQGGSVAVNGSGVSQAVTFSLANHRVVFAETGLPAKKLARWGWTVVLNGTPKHSTGSTVGFTVETGTYSMLVVGPHDFQALTIRLGSGATPATPLNVSSNLSLTIAFVKGDTPPVTFGERGLPRGQSWCVELSGFAQCTTGRHLAYGNLTPATYPYAVLSPLVGQKLTATVGKTSVPTSGTLNVTKGTHVTLRFLYPYALTFTESGLSAGNWSITVDRLTETAAAGSPIVFELKNHTYRYQIGAETGYAASGSPRPVPVQGAPAYVSVTFTPRLAPLTVGRLGHSYRFGPPAAEGGPGFVGWGMAGWLDLVLLQSGPWPSTSPAVPVTGWAYRSVLCRAALRSVSRMILKTGPPSSLGLSPDTRFSRRGIH